jgi:transposase
LLMSVVVTEANVHDSVAAERVTKRMKGAFPRLRKILGDGGYAGARLAELAQKHLKADLEVVTRSDEAGFKVIPQRWVVERSIAWFSWFRRLSRDYEANMVTSEAWVLLASIVMMIKKI